MILAFSPHSYINLRWMCDENWEKLCLILLHIRNSQLLLSSTLPQWIWVSFELLRMHKKINDVRLKKKILQKPRHITYNSSSNSRHYKFQYLSYNFCSGHWNQNKREIKLSLFVALSIHRRRRRRQHKKKRKRMHFFQVFQRTKKVSSKNEI
jgi:hypothetical protein